VLASLKTFRRRIGAFIGGFEAGLANRRLIGVQPSRTHINALIAAAGPDITTRARWLIRNNGYAANAMLGGQRKRRRHQAIIADQRRRPERTSSLVPNRQTIVPNNFPIPAVSAIAKAPQNASFPKIQSSCLNFV
jgi:capsid protein